MTKKIYLFIFCLLFTLQAISQQTLSGSIQTADNTTLIGATLVATHDNGTEVGTTSDSDGNFSIDLYDAGNYNLDISYIGYMTYSTNVKISSSNNVDIGKITLIESSQILQSVEVVGRQRKDYNSDYSFSGSKIATLNKELPQAISTVTKELISDRQAFQLVDAVKTVSNVAATGIYNHYNIRGITQADDGQVVNGLRTRQYYFLQPITSHIERVEVIKGPSSVTFSSADPGGTVNIVTKKTFKRKKRRGFLIYW